MKKGIVVLFLFLFCSSVFAARLQCKENKGAGEAVSEASTAPPECYPSADASDREVNISKTLALLTAEEMGSEEATPDTPPGESGTFQ